MKSYNRLFKARWPYSIRHLDLGRFTTSIHLMLTILIQLLALIGTPIFEWYVVRCRSKNKHQKYTCLKEMELAHAHNLIIFQTQQSTSFMDTYMIIQ